MNNQQMYRRGSIGRFGRGSAYPTLPPAYVETGGNLAASAGDLLWQLPNTFGMVRLDTRKTRFGNGDEDPQIVNPAPAAFAPQLALVVGAYVQRFQSVFAAEGKPMRYDRVRRWVLSRTVARNHSIRWWTRSG